VLENPKMDVFSEPLQDGVEQDDVSPHELVESPTGACENVSRPFRLMCCTWMTS
jgi:hypothetical protein